jgi:hypothetical protein
VATHRWHDIFAPWYVEVGTESVFVAVAVVYNRVLPDVQLAVDNPKTPRLLDHNVTGLLPPSGSVPKKRESI